MAQAMAEEGGRVPMSPGLQSTLLRARDYAASQAQPQVLLEHLLLALSEDVDAAHVLEASAIDLNRLRNDVAGYIGAMPERVPPGATGGPAISPALTQVLKYATLAAQQGRRSSIDGAIVLAALVGDGRSMAASFLKAQGLTFEAAIKALRDASARPLPQPVQPLPQPVQPPPQPVQPPLQPIAPLPAATAPEPPATPGREAPAARQTPQPEPTTSRAEHLLAAARERLVTRAAQAGRTEPGQRPGGSGTAAAIASPTPPQPAESTAPPALAAGDPRPQTPVASAVPVPAAGQSSPAPGAAPDGAAATPPPAGPHSFPSAPAQTAAVSPAGSAPQRPMPQPPVAQPPQALPAPHAMAAQPQPPAPPPRVQSQAPAAASQATAWAPPPVAPLLQPGPPVNRAMPPAPPAGWGARPAAAPAPAPPGPGRTAVLERPLATAPWAEPPAGPRLPPQEPARPFTGPPGAPGGEPLAPLAPVAPAPMRGPAIDPTRVAHNIPSRLKQGHARVIEVRIDRPPLADGGGGGARPHSLRGESMVARAIAVRLRPVAGRFIVDAASPETLWDQSDAAGGAGRLAGEAAVWRFTVTPLATGKGTLQLAVSARTMGADGVLAETQLPEQAFEVRVAPDIPGLLARAGTYAGIAVGAMLLIKLAEGLLGVDLFFLVRQLLR